MDEQRWRTLETIASDCGVPIETGRRLSELTSLGVGGEISALLRPRSTASLAALLASLHAEAFRPRVLGGGANVAGGPGPFEDPIVLTRTLRQEPELEGRRLRVGAGYNIKRTVLACVRRGLAGLEWAEGIPGTMGGAIVMNAGAYGGQTSDHIVEVEWLAPDGSARRRHVAKEDFAYRSSPFRAEGVVIGATFELEPDDPRAIESRMREMQARRMKGQPPRERSAGCIFKNPPGDSAGRVIDAAGLKGTSVGGASVSEVHANFIVNRGDASSDDVFELIERVKATVLRVSGIALEEEVVRWL